MRSSRRCGIRRTTTGTAGGCSSRCRPDETGPHSRPPRPRPAAPPPSKSPRPCLVQPAAELRVADASTRRAVAQTSLAGRGDDRRAPQQRRQQRLVTHQPVRFGHIRTRPNPHARAKERSTGAVSGAAHPRSRSRNQGRARGGSCKCANVRFSLGKRGMPTVGLLLLRRLPPRLARLRLSAVRGEIALKSCLEGGTS